MSPRNEELNEAMRSEARSRIMQVALSLFSERGYESTSVRLIAETAGISQGLMYNYFSGKEELLEAIFRSSLQDIRESFALAEAATSPDQRIAALIRGAFQLVRENLTFWRLSYAVRMQTKVLKTLDQSLQEWTSQIAQTIEGYFRAINAPQPAIEAAILFALIDGISQHYVLDPEHYPLEAVTERLVARYQSDN